ncbi:MAG: hypothetical protein NPIRA04_33550 [Nitrospirales bacterium]|nr:MAG: hypothetical protein NPIRA04_33550 [Nitrospirales bacterium]
MRKSKRLVGIILIVLVSASSIGIWIFLIDSTPTVRIFSEEFRFVPEKIALTEFQDVRFVINNQGREPHTFYGSFFSDPTVHIIWESADRPRQYGKAIYLSPGKSVSLLARFSAGIYPFRCVIRGHRGMEGIVVVHKEGEETEAAK